jgi:hypothetical protein
MDCADSLLIDHSGTLTPATSFLRLLSLIKGLQPKTTILSDIGLSPAIEHRNIQIQGFWPAVHYLLDLRPYPELLPLTPSRRGVIASLTELVLTNAAYLAQVAPLYAKSPQALSNQPTLLDVAVASYCNTELETPYPWIRNVGVHLHNFILLLEDIE